MVRSLSSAPVAVKRRATTLAFKSAAAMLILYQPLATSVTEFAQEAKEPPSRDRVAVTVKPVNGAWLVWSVIRKLKLLSAWFFLIFDAPPATETTLTPSWAVDVLTAELAMFFK